MLLVNIRGSTGNCLSLTQVRSEGANPLSDSSICHMESCSHSAAEPVHRYSNFPCHEYELDCQMTLQCLLQVHEDSEDRPHCKDKWSVQPHDTRGRVSTRSPPNYFTCHALNRHRPSRDHRLPLGFDFSNETAACILGLPSLNVNECISRVILPPHCSSSGRRAGNQS